MSLKLFRRDGFWHYRGTIGPKERRKFFRASTGLEDTAKNKSTAQRYVTEKIETPYWRGHLDGPSSILTFEVACQKYLAGGGSDLFLQPVREHLGSRLVKDLKSSVIREAANALYGHCAGATKNRMGITPVQAVINSCAEAELCPPIRVKRFKEFTKVKTPATLEWIRAFQATASEVLGAYALFMFVTGCRPSEGLAIDAERDLDLPNRTVIINNGKVGHERRAHLPAPLVTTLANMPRETGRPLFWYRDLKVVRWPWDQAIRRAGIKRLTPHCCRHGAVTALLRARIDVVTVGKLVDMTPEMVLKTYGHAIDDPTLNERLLDAPLSEDFAEVVERTKIAG